MSNKVKLTLLAVFWIHLPIAFCLNAYQEQDSELSDVFKLSLKNLLDVKVISASKFTEKTSEASSVITAFQHSQIENYGWNKINDVLYLQPGFGPSQDYDRPTVATRGNFDSWSNNHILHLIDGIPVNDNLYGTAYTWLIPLFTTKTLEVIRGPGSSLYGSNATNGVVQMNTFKASDLNGKSHAKISIGNQSNQGVEIMTGAFSGDYDFIMAFSNHHTDGNQYLSFDGSNRLQTLNDENTGRPKSQLLLTRDNREDSYFWSKFSYKDSLNIQYQRQQWDFDTGHGWVFWIPDFDEEMNEYRNILSVKYQDSSNPKLHQEFVLRYQNHHITWNQRYYPNGAFADFYPAGMWEFLDTDAEDIFLRAQWTYFEPQDDSVWLLGIEADYFHYDGDKEHNSNVDVDSDFFEPFANNSTQSLGPWLDYILNEPVINTAIYGQYTNQQFFDKKLNITLGIRWDKLAVNYRDINNNNAKQSKDLSRASPRVALVYKQNDYIYKLLAGQAFRAPTPTEMAGAHTFSLASNIEQLEPELLTNYEFQFNWNIDEQHIFRSNLFQVEFENQIAYSTVNFNLSTNVYSTKNAGIELELLGQYQNLDWFANLSLTKRIDETILAFFEDENNPNAAPIPEFTEHSNNLKWEPGVKLNLGINYQADDWNIALSLHYHNEVERRDNELGNPNGFLPLGVDVPTNYSLNDHRPQTISSWTKLDANFQYHISENIKLGLNIRNLFDTDARLIKVGPFPFDYKLNSRQVNAFVIAKF